MAPRALAELKRRRRTGPPPRLGRAFVVALLAAAGLDAPAPARPPPLLGAGVAEQPLAESAEAAGGGAYVLRGAASGAAFAPREWASLRSRQPDSAARRGLRARLHVLRRDAPGGGGGHFCSTQHEPPNVGARVGCPRRPWRTRTRLGLSTTCKRRSRALLSKARRRPPHQLPPPPLGCQMGATQPRARGSRAGHVSTLHYDASDSLLMQLRGSKTIVVRAARGARVLRPGPDSHPLRRRCRADPRLPAGAPGGPCGRRRRPRGDLRPGDVLVLPARCAHWTRSDTAAISLTARFEAATPVDGV